MAGEIIGGTSVILLKGETVVTNGPIHVRITVDGSGKTLSFGGTMLVNIDGQIRPGVNSIRVNELKTIVYRGIVYSPINLGHIPGLIAKGEKAVVLSDELPGVNYIDGTDIGFSVRKGRDEYGMAYEERQSLAIDHVLIRPARG
jgi:hypothetical protein